MPRIPRERTLDSTIALLSEGYAFISNRCERYGTDAFETRLMLQKVVCTRGEDAARMFYEPGRFTRRKALPPTTLLLLLDKGSVSTLDDDAHRSRKRMFMSLMGPGALERMADALDVEWRARLPEWSRRDRIVLHDEVQGILCRAVATWAGTPLDASQAEERTREFAAMVEGAGAVGPRNWRGLVLRMRTEQWAQDVLRRVRDGRLGAPEGSAARVIANHRDEDGRLLPVDVAAVELINVLRPTVAVARFVTFTALALHEHPEWREKLREDDAWVEPFVQEVRRYYPFFPFVGGRVLEPFTWRNHRFDEGDRVILDLYGTDRDPGTWEDPDAFRPERFRERDENAFDLIPQGGGDHYANHRCAGEWLTIELMKRALRVLVHGMEYDVPEQDLAIDLGRMPAIPGSGFVIRNVKPARALAA